MTTIINASSVNGITISSDTSGQIALQSNGTTVATVSAGAFSATGVTIGSYTPAASLITAGTPQTVSGTAVTFSSIPSWVKRITIMFDNILFATADKLQLQLVTSGGTIATGYNSGNWLANTVNVYGTTAFNLIAYPYNTIYFSGICTLALLNSSTNLWAQNAVLSSAAGAAYTTVSGGSVTLSALLTGLKLSGTSGNSFASGSVNILYE